MAEAIPKQQWSEAEEYGERLFYWRYLVNKWLVAGPSVVQEREFKHELAIPGEESLLDYGYLMEPESVCEH